MSPEVTNVLFDKMKISIKHFKEKYNNFTTEIQRVIDSRLSEMLEMSYSIKNGDTETKAFNALFYSDGDDLTNEFIQSMFDCFKEWQSYDGLLLQMNLYEHTNRGTDNWFPLVTIAEKINECTLDGEFITVYRGCNIEEYETNTYRQRQSWTTDLAVAKVFAFNHPSTRSCLENRIVIKAVVKKIDILWARVYESEMVIKLDFSAESAVIKITYEDYRNQQED